MLPVRSRNGAVWSNVVVGGELLVLCYLLTVCFNLRLEYECIAARWNGLVGVSNGKDGFVIIDDENCMDDTGWLLVGKEGTA